MNRADVERAGPARPARAGLGWPVLIWILGAALSSVLLAWWLTPRTPDVFSGVRTALGSDAQQTGTSGSQVFVYPPSASSSSGQQGSPPSGPGTASQAPLSIGTETAIALNVGRAYAYSPSIAVEIGSNQTAAVAPVGVTAGPSAVPLVLASALVAALAGLGGALLSRRATAVPAPVLPAAGPAIIPAGPEPVSSQELYRLRAGMRQKASLARSLAQLIPSMPDALVWQAEKALSEAGVRAVVPDGEPFDAAFHHAVGTEPVPPGGRENTVARTVRPGYADDEQILVHPRVVVYVAAGRAT